MRGAGAAKIVAGRGALVLSEHAFGAKLEVLRDPTGFVQRARQKRGGGCFETLNHRARLADTVDVQVPGKLDPEHDGARFKGFLRELAQQISWHRQHLVPVYHRSPDGPNLRQDSVVIRV